MRFGPWHRICHTSPHFVQLEIRKLSHRHLFGAMLTLSSLAALPPTPFEVMCDTMLCKSNLERITIKEAPAPQPKVRVLNVTEVKGSVGLQFEQQLYSGARKAVGKHHFIANSVFKTCQKLQQPFFAHKCYNRPARAIKIGQKPFCAHKCYNRPATANRAKVRVVKGSVSTEFLRAGLPLRPYENTIIPMLSRSSGNLAGHRAEPFHMPSGRFVGNIAERWDSRMSENVLPAPYPEQWKTRMSERVRPGHLYKIGPMGQWYWLDAHK